jgi:hypothetical protein
MRHHTAGVAMMLDRRFQPRAGSVAISAKTRPMADRADPLTAHGGQTVIVSEPWGVLKSPEREFMGFGIMALRTSAQVSFFPRMLQGQVFTMGPAGTGQHGSSQKDDAQDDKKCVRCDLGHVSPA